MENGYCHYIRAITYFKTYLTTIEPSEALLLPDCRHGVGEVGVLAAAAFMTWGVLPQWLGTSMLRRVLAMSRGLQAVTEMRPATSPDRKMVNCLCSG